MTRSNRQPQFDAIRIIAILLIFNYHFCTAIGATNSIFCGYKNGGWGSVGTCIFFLLSGFLIHMSNQELDLKTYFKKRFYSIFPALWLSFMLVYIYISWQHQDPFWGGHPAKLVLSFLGVDTYLQYYNILTYACVGEWFTTIILVLYILYPLLRILIKKLPYSTTMLISLLYFAENFFGIQPVVPSDASIFSALLIFWLGMLCEEYPQILTPNVFKTIFFVAVAALVLVIELPYVGNPLPWKYTLAVSLFYLMLALFSRFPYSKKCTDVLKYFGSITFCIYLIHHVVMLNLINYFSNLNHIILYILSLVLSIIFGAIIHFISTKWRPF